MSTDDIIYLAALFSCIIFGHFYKSFPSDEKKKWIGTTFGLAIVFVVSGFHILHVLIPAMICTLIILHAKISICHIIAFVFMFIYLLFFRMARYFGLPTPPGHTNLIQMILTLKLVGLAFERNTFQHKRHIHEGDHKDSEHDSEFGKAMQHLTFIDIFHYCFNFIGVLTGPYFRYRTFHDYFTMPFKDHAKSVHATISKFKLVPIFAALFLLFSHLWPLEYATSDEFYEQRSFFYRLMYVWPTFFIFRMRIYIGLTLSECVCTLAGFGAYPKEAESTAGGGPSKDYIHYIQNPEKLDYDFETIHNIDPIKTEKCWTFREAMKSWNMCVQYWLAMYVYKRFPNKKFRTVVTMLVSAYWHGVYPGYYFTILGAPFYMPIETLADKVIRRHATGLKRNLINVIFWINKFFAFSYLAIAFLLLTMDKIWFYYKSVYHFGYLYFALLYVAILGYSKICRTPRQNQTHSEHHKDHLTKETKVQ